jgi:pyruvate formate lyase activating enzyme
MGFLWGNGGEARPVDTPGVFRKGAPSEEVFEAWRQRGWVREAYHYRKVGETAQCGICPNHCALEPGDRSHCRDRVNRGGTLFTLAYGNACTFHIDPVEKKPLYHFLPGTKTFSLAAAGCVLRCLNCQNWEISQSRPEDLKRPHGAELRVNSAARLPAGLDEMSRMSLMPEDIATLAAELGCPSVSYTYSEPVAWYEYAYDSGKAVRARNLRNILVTSGYIKEEALRDICQHLDAAHVDLKGFDPATYERLNGGRLQPVLDALKVMKSCGVWLEVISLVVPTHTDDPGRIRQMCDWLAANLGADTPLHFTRFHPAHKLTALPPTPVDALVKARDSARAAGLRHVYIGNVRGVPDAGTTFCPDCRKPVVERDVYSVTLTNLHDGACGACSAMIAGVWS